MLCLDSTVGPLRLHWVKDVCMFRHNLPPALWAEWLRSFMCHCCNTGLNGHWIRAQKVSPGEESSAATPVRMWTHNLSITRLVFYQQAIPAPPFFLYVHVKGPVTNDHPSKIIFACMLGRFENRGSIDWNRKRVHSRVHTHLKSKSQSGYLRSNCFRDWVTRMF